MKSFLTPLVVSPLPDGKTWRLISGFTYKNGKKGTIVIPVGFETDFASTPWFIWWLFPPWGKYGKAAVLHDYLYKNKLSHRQWSDEMFFEAMVCCGTPVWKAKIIYYSVRLLGWKAW